MTELHPITPSPELIEEWIELSRPQKDRSPNPNVLATYAARWGADQELEACCDVLEGWGSCIMPDLRAARRPKPPSLKEQALKELKDWTDEKHGPGGEVFLCEGLSVALIREALESLPD